MEPVSGFEPLTVRLQGGTPEHGGGALNLSAHRRIVSLGYIAPSRDPNTAPGHDLTCSDREELMRNFTGSRLVPRSVRPSRRPLFLAGLPTKLVRDGERESYDLPPDQPLPEADLVPAEQPGGEAVDGSDLLRADQTSSGRYDHDKALNEAFGMAW